MCENLSKRTPVDLKLKKHWALSVKQHDKRSIVTVNLPKDLYVPCDKCTGINCNEENDDTCGVCQGSQESECHQCGGAGRVIGFDKKSKFI